MPFIALGPEIQTLDLPLYPQKPSMSGPETADSPQVKLTRSLIGSMTTKDIDFFHKFLHKDFRRVTYPKSISRPEYDKEGWIQQIAELFTIWPEGGGEVSCIGCQH